MNLRWQWWHETHPDDRRQVLGYAALGVVAVIVGIAWVFWTSSQPVETSAVRIVQDAAQLDQCDSLGEVSSALPVSVKRHGDYVAQHRLQTMAELRNRAERLGGNVVFVEPGQHGLTTRGQVYRCE